MQPPATCVSRKSGKLRSLFVKIWITWTFRSTKQQTVYDNKQSFHLSWVVYCCSFWHYRFYEIVSCQWDWWPFEKRFTMNAKKEKLVDESMYGCQGCLPKLSLWMVGGALRVQKRTCRHDENSVRQRLRQWCIGYTSKTFLQNFDDTHWTRLITGTGCWRRRVQLNLQSELQQFRWNAWWHESDGKKCQRQRLAKTISRIYKVKTKAKSGRHCKRGCTSKASATPCRALTLGTRDLWRVFALASCTKKRTVSRDHLSPTSAARTSDFVLRVFLWVQGTNVRSFFLEWCNKKLKCIFQSMPWQFRAI